MLLLQAVEVTSLKRDAERQKELVLSAEVQAKFHQTRLKEEQDQHKVGLVIVIIILTLLNPSLSRDS